MKRSTFITWDQLKVGAIILIAMAVLFIAIMRLDAAIQLFNKRYQLVALLSNASGLRQGGSVTVAGQLAGTVKSIEFLPVDGDTTSSPAVAVNGGSGAYDVLVDKTDAGAESYTMTFHCFTGPDGTGFHTGTSLTILQDQ
jgi:hypothetical protein